MPTCDECKRARQRRRQARYEARQRAGIAVYPVTLDADAIGSLITLGWLREGAETDRALVGEAVARALHSLHR